jgi:O-antigen ligase
MSAGVTTSPALPIWRDPAAWTRSADVFVILTALALPWSTSLVAIFAVAWLVTLVPTLDIKYFIQTLKRPICALPIALFGLAAVGTVWSDAPWVTRLYAISPTAKLLVLPALFYHFERSSRGLWAFIAFLVSCTLLMAMSWIVAFDPRLALKSGAEYGIPVKNYIDQSQEFALCAVALAYPIAMFLRTKRFLMAALLYRDCNELRRQHDVCRRLTDGASHGTNHAGCIRASSFTMAKCGDVGLRDPYFGGRSLDGLTYFARENCCFLRRL